MGIERGHARSLRRSSIQFATAVLIWIILSITINITSINESILSISNSFTASSDALVTEPTDHASHHSVHIQLQTFRSTNHPVKETCNFMGFYYDQLSHRNFEMEAKVIDGFSPYSSTRGTGVDVTISWACRLPPGIAQPRAMFRVRTEGESYTAVLPQSTILRAPDESINVFIPVVDAGEHTLLVSLITMNLTDADLYIDWPSHAATTIEWNTLTSRYVDKYIKGSPFLFNMSTRESNKRRSYDEVLSIAVPPAGQPLCFDDQSSNVTLPGRWLRGPRHPHITHQWQSRSIFDDFMPVWAPFDCHIDYTISLIDSLRSLGWFQVTGDSNMRGLFERICQVTNGTLYKGSQSVRFMDPPHLCLLDEGRTIVTFNNWFYGKLPTWHPQWTFHEQCEMYTENLTKMYADNTIFGWPGCELAHPTIHSMPGPALTYLSWGSHAAEAGLTPHTWSFIDGPQMLGHDYFKKFPTLMAFTEDVYATIIPYQKGPHYVYRNNERIQSFNQFLVDSVRHHWDSWPIDMLDENNQIVKGFTPIFDVFSPTHAASEVLHGDAVHFYYETEIQIAKWIAHWVRYAPQLRPGLRRIPNNTAI